MRPAQVIYSALMLALPSMALAQQFVCKARDVAWAGETGENIESLGVDSEDVENGISPVLATAYLVSPVERSGSQYYQISEDGKDSSDHFCQGFEPSFLEENGEMLNCMSFLGTFRMNRKSRKFVATIDSHFLTAGLVGPLLVNGGCTRM